MHDARSFSTALCVVMLASASPVAAQSVTDPGITVGVSVGTFDDYPSQFSPAFCTQEGRGVTGKVGYWVTSMLAFEASATLSGSRGEERCSFPGAPPPIDGGFFSRSVFDEDIPGRSFFATNIATVFEPLASRIVSPRVQAGVGRLWDKELGNWFYGGGVRVRVGPAAVVAEVERWNLSFDMRRELLIFRDSGAHELQSFEIIPQNPRPYFFRIGLEYRVR